MIGEIPQEFSASGWTDTNLSGRSTIRPLTRRP